MATLGEAFQALGTGFATAAEDREERMRKLMREQQRRQLLTAALTPIATGVSKAVTDFISEPFKQSATNYFRGTKGGQYKTDLMRRNTLEAGARARDKKVQEQGGLQFFSEELRKNGGDTAFENWSRETYGTKEPSTFSSYHDARKAYDRFVETQAAQELREHNELMDFLNRTTLTDEQEKALIKKYSPVSQGLGQGLWRFGSRMFKRLTKEEDRAERLKLLRDKTGLNEATIAKMEELNKLGSEYGFSRDVLEAIPELNTEKVQKDAKVYRDSLALSEHMRGQPPALRRIYSKVVKDLGMMATLDQVELAVAENAFAITKTNLAEEEKAFVARQLRGPVRNENFARFIEGARNRNLTESQISSEIENQVKASYTLARSWVNRDIASGRIPQKNLIGAEAATLYADLVRARADYLITNHTQFIEEETYKVERSPFNPMSWLFGDADVKVKNPRLAIEEDFYSSATATTATGAPAPAPAAGAGAGDAAAVQQPVQVRAERVDLSLAENASVRARWEAAWKQALRQDDPLSAWEEAESLLTSEILNTFSDSDNVEIMVTNLPFQSEIDALRSPVLTKIEQLMGSPERSRGTDTAGIYDRDLSKFRRGPDLGFLANLIEGLERIGVRNDLAETYESLTRATEGPVTAITQPLAILIDSIIPEAQAAPVQEEQPDSLLSGTSVSRYVDRQKQREQDLFANKGTIKVSVGNKAVEVDTADPVSFLRDRFSREQDDPQRLTFNEGVIAYKEAIEKHNQNRRNTTYTLDPVYHSILYSMKADGRYSTDRLNEMADEREQSKEEGIKLKDKIESRIEEVERYKNIVSDMTDAQKEQEFKRQLDKARKQPISSEEGLINNAIEFLKLQSIFGEGNNRDITRRNEEPVTVNDKVTQYYDYLDLYEDDNYDRQTNLYRRLAVGLSTPSQPTSLLAQL